MNDNNLLLQRRRPLFPSLLLTILILSIALSRPATTTTAFPTGAGACPTGRAAVADSHVTATNLINGTLEDGNIQVFVDDDRLRAGRQYTVWIGKPTEIIIRSPLSRAGVKGFLVRLGSSKELSKDDTASTITYDLTTSLSAIPNNENNPFLEPDANAVQVVEDQFCGHQAGGITHTDATPKSLIRAQLFLDKDEAEASNDGLLDNLILDVTVVMENTGNKSEYYYSQYQLRAAVEGVAATEEDDTSFITFGGSAPSAAPKRLLSLCTTTILFGACLAGLFFIAVY